MGVRRGGEGGEEGEMILHGCNLATWANMCHGFN